MITMYKKDKRFKNWKWKPSPSRLFDLYSVGENGDRHLIYTDFKRERVRHYKKRIEEAGGVAIIIGRV